MNIFEALHGREIHQQPPRADPVPFAELDDEDVIFFARCHGWHVEEFIPWDDSDGDLDTWIYERGPIVVAWFPCAGCWRNSNFDDFEDVSAPNSYSARIGPNSYLDDPTG